MPLSHKRYDMNKLIEKNFYLLNIKMRITYFHQSHFLSDPDILIRFRSNVNEKQFIQSYSIGTSVVTVNVVKINQFRRCNIVSFQIH